VTIVVLGTTIPTGFPGRPGAVFTGNLQVTSVQERLARAPQAVDAVRVLKKWRNGVDWGTLKKPSSYFLELVVMQAAATSESESSLAQTAVTAAPAVPLVSPATGTLRRLLVSAFNKMAKLAAKSTAHRHLPDVAAPSNNVAKSLSDEVWTRLGELCEAELGTVARVHCTPGRRPMPRPPSRKPPRNV
jgi:hypothetical protein